MSDVYTFTAGRTPLLVSIPHDGRDLSPGLGRRLTADGRRLPDTDWHVRRLYGFAAECGASVLAANYSRYVVDLNRPPDDAELYPGRTATGLCPTQTFAGQSVYQEGEEPGTDEQAARLETYWRPYHERLRAELERIRERYGVALLWDAHSIASRLPRIFDGTLPVINIGTDGGRSCDGPLSRAVCEEADRSTYSTVINGRFRGGYITRHYGNPDGGIHAIQLELAQRAYMDERSGDYDEEGAARLAVTLRSMLATFMARAEDLQAFSGNS